MTRHEVSAYTVYPTGFDDATFADKYLWTVQVENTGEDTWAVRKSVKQCLNHDNGWDVEHIPSERTDEWLAAHRFPKDEALRRAAAVVDSLRFNGNTIAEADAEVAARMAAFDRMHS